jgi:hypothetical protein
MNLLVNFLLYQIGWFAIVIGAGIGRPWLGGGISAVLVVVHYVMVEQRSRHLLLGAVAGLVGVALDSFQLALGVFEFPSGAVSQWLVPPWIAVLWIQFATILPFCLRWLSGRYGLAAALGLVGGPLAFYAGERFGAVLFLEPRGFHYLILGMVWGVALPALVFLSDRIVACGPQGALYGWAARLRTRSPETAN